MASLIEELIARQSQRQAPQAIMSDPGSMMSFLSQGNQTTNPLAGAMMNMLNTRAPEVNLPNLPTYQRSGIGSQVIGNLLNQYAEKQLKSKFDKDTAEETSKYLKPIVDDQIESTAPKSAIHNFLNSVSKGLESNNPSLVSLAANQYTKYADSMADNFKMTSDQKNLGDPGVINRQDLIRAENRIPTGFNPTGAQGQIESMTLPDGKLYSDLVTERMQAAKATPAWGQPEQLDLAMKRDVRDEQRLQQQERKIQVDEIKAISKENVEKLDNIAPAHRMVWATNKAAIDQIDKTLDELKDDKLDVHFGAKNYAPDAAIQRLDPEGVRYRALVGKIRNIDMLDTSGKTITKDEQGRLKPVVPNLTDDLPAIRQKLLTMKQFAQGNSDKVEQMYSPKGYKNLPWLEGTQNKNTSSEPVYEYRINPANGKKERRRIR